MRFSLGYYVATLYSDREELCEDVSELEVLDFVKVLDQSMVQKYMDLFNLPYSFFEDTHSRFINGSGRKITSHNFLLDLFAQKLAFNNKKLSPEALRVLNQMDYNIDGF